MPGEVKDARPRKFLLKARDRKLLTRQQASIWKERGNRFGLSLCARKRRKPIAIPLRATDNQGPSFGPGSSLTISRPPRHEPHDTGSVANREGLDEKSAGRRVS